MRITLNKDIHPQIASLLSGIKSMQLYSFDGYDQDESIIEAPSIDIVLNVAIDIARIGAVINAYEYWIEIPDTNINDIINSEISWADGIMTWADLGLNSQGVSNSLRYWQAANNGQFIYQDVEIIEKAGFAVYGKQSLLMRLNDPEYSDINDPKYSELVTIEWVDKNWRYGSYFDIVDACLTMRAIYEAKDTTDALRWAACTTSEKIVLVRWNQVGLNRASDLILGSWSEAKALKELARQYREFNANIAKDLIIRFDNWYQYLNMILSGTGRTKFASDWDWNLREEYIHKHLHFYELGVTNALLDWHDTTFSTYVDADFITSTLTANQLVTNLRKVLADNKYFI